jgi:hypothetical protein
MSTTILIQLPDGTYAAINRSLTWGEAVIILLLVAIVFLQVYGLWSAQWQQLHNQAQ